MEYQPGGELFSHLAKEGLLMEVGISISHGGSFKRCVGQSQVLYCGNGLGYRAFATARASSIGAFASRCRPSPYVAWQRSQARERAHFSRGARQAHWYTRLFSILTECLTIENVDFGLAKQVNDVQIALSMQWRDAHDDIVGRRSVYLLRHARVHGLLTITLSSMNYLNYFI